jgi:hypothetical protein
MSGRSHRKQATKRGPAPAVVHSKRRGLRFSIHAVDRYVERCRPGLSTVEGLAELRALVANGTWLRDRSKLGDAQTEITLPDGRRAVAIIRRDAAGAICTTVVMLGEEHDGAEAVLCEPHRAPLPCRQCHEAEIADARKTVVERARFLVVGLGHDAMDRLRDAVHNLTAIEDRHSTAPTGAR